MVIFEWSGLFSLCQYNSSVEKNSIVEFSYIGRNEFIKLLKNLTFQQVIKKIICII